VFRRNGTRGTWYAHASVGTLHVRPILDMRVGGDDGGAARMRRIAEEASELVRRFKGAFSGEHGDGLVRSEWVDWQFGPRLTRAFESVKDAFDPQGLMNPGKIVRSTRMDDRSLFRFKPGYRVTPLDTGLDWSAWNVRNDPLTETVSAPGTGGDPAGGFAKAVDMCNNNGHCRKFDAGAMCPSWRVTGDEQHLTRGRANSLRLALSGQLGPDALTSDEMAQTMSLCVGCKACRRECPTGVDMSRMKTEYLYQLRKRQPAPLRERLIARLPRLAPWLSRFAPLINAAQAMPGAAWARERVLGLAARRSLPTWRRDVFTADSIQAAGALPPADSKTDSPSPEGKPALPGRQVILFADTFNNHFEPDNLRAARAVLIAAGYQVQVARAAADDAEPRRALCCGRTLLAAGFVDEARVEAQRVLKALLPAIDRGVSVVGLEPSCLLSLRDEFLALGLGPDAQRLAESAFLFEEFLDRELSAKRLSLPLKPMPGKNFLVHGHCHQKAFDAMTPVQRILGLIEGARVSVIESSCCGMAGAFGYQAEHYETSRQMSELSLLPAVRAADANCTVVADGTSCRHQILDGTGRTAVHVAEVLAAALQPAELRLSRGEVVGLASTGG
jgi:Fe-S oxidoreductase